MTDIWLLTAARTAAEVFLKLAQFVKFLVEIQKFVFTSACAWYKLEI